VDELQRQLAAARLDNVRLFNETKEALERQTAISDILRVISASPTGLGPVLDALAESAVRFCGAEDASVMLLREDGYEPAAHYGHLEGHIERYALDRGSVTGRAILELRTVHAEDVTHDDEFPLSKRYAEMDGQRTVLAAPLIREGKALGAIALRRGEPRPFTDRQIELARTFADQAVIAIENVRLLQAVERQRQELTRFVSPQVASLLTSDEGQRLLEGHRRAITVLFCDLRGFSAFSETAEPEEVLGVLREYHAAMGELIVAHGGTLEHFAGDGMMVFFNDPVPVADHELRAVRLAVAMRDRFEAMAQSWRRKGYELGFGIGAAVGHATLGRIGFEGRYDYGAIGNAVIIASRLSGEAKAGQILLTQRLHAAVEQHVDGEAIGELSLRGQTRPVAAFNVRSLRAPE
jgi:adenylate cyclase